MAIDMDALTPDDRAALPPEWIVEQNAMADKPIKLDAIPLQPIAQVWPMKRRKKREGPSEPEKVFLAAAEMAAARLQILCLAYQPQPPFILDGNTQYVPDFKIWRMDKSIIYVETKGRRMTSESLTRMKLRQCSERYPEHAWWLARWEKKAWKVQEVVGGVIRRKALVVPWLS